MENKPINPMPDNDYRICGCVGYGYVPIQRLGCIYCPDDALIAGTIFGELDLDITEYGKVCKAGGNINE